MFISQIAIRNYRLFTPDRLFTIDNFNVPNGTEEGSGLNVFVGENGCGKTSLLEALALPMLEYKVDSFSVDDMNDPSKDVEISIYSDKPFKVLGTMPKSDFMAKGFVFKARCRARSSKAYLSSLIVTDQLFISTDPDKPKENSPDLRVRVYNPFSGNRFNENDVLLLDKNRLYQTRSGNFNTTRFDRLMEDFNYQYLKNTNPIKNLNDYLNKEIKQNKIQNSFLEKSINKFKEFSGIKISLDFIDNYRPFNNACFVAEKDNMQQIHISNLGSGYEMIFALLYSFYLSQQSGKQLILLIDEPELHLHPVLQEKFIQFLLEISKEVQVFLSTHSPLLVKQLSFNDRVSVRILSKDGLLPMEERKLSYISSNETNYLAFNLASEEYHNELYEELLYRYGEGQKIKEFDNAFFVKLKGEPPNCPWKGVDNQVSIHTYIRNQIHHQKDNGRPNYTDLIHSIKKMRSYL